mgnify:CR=1 FL=1
MSNTFEILMDQLDMPLEMRSSSAFLHAEIQEVVVHKVSRFGSSALPLWKSCRLLCLRNCASV